MGYKFSPLAPADNAVAVTPSDATVIPVTRGLYIGGAGNVNVRMHGGGTVVFTAPAVGYILDIAVDKVLSTSTTATSILALY